ncbi:KpsF/GutQ family sugar-phosphate isomerase [Comamonas sp. 17RB]|uniref:KpsF/GutQ family sugar-phosphate isomerase n=1 Tax=Comamonas sp. 17RB TaxID=3047025 RepID=UPI0024B72AED|nr:KpsF/GutQ family sugar-phosphate isomerase [Comamonas sp. 17RB]MDI9855070.1 KpsF/GutQ family sugar-phosphate isomerase [Comamonas sp. 17RB]
MNEGAACGALAIAQETLDIEIEALKRMRDRLDSRINEAVELILAMQGRVVVVGMGKSGIIGQKIAATLASTGTPAFFVHPGEAFHGDLGMIKPIDVALLISNSGETEEVLRVLPFLQYQQNKMIALTGKMDSTLAQYSHVALDVGVEREACKNNLAPTSSTTNTLAMGDALAVALTVKRDFQPEDFARFHPGGSLGRRLLTRVCDVMHKDPLPVCAPDASFRDVVNSITYGRLGLTLVMGGEMLKGIITDGDLRRAFEAQDEVKNLTAAQLMSPNPLTIAANTRFADAEAFMREKKVGALVVQDAQGSTVGVLQIYSMTQLPPAV